MRRRLGSMLGIFVISTSVFVGASTLPASAAICAGQGVMLLERGIGLPVLGARSNVGFTIFFPCTVRGAGDPTPAIATGNIASAACGLSKGGKGTIFGKSFAFHGVGTLFVVNNRNLNGIQGVFNVVPDARVNNNSCTDGTARQFVVTAALRGPW